MVGKAHSSSCRLYLIIVMISFISYINEFYLIEFHNNNLSSSELIIGLSTKIRSHEYCLLSETECF